MKSEGVGAFGEVVGRIHHWQLAAMGIEPTQRELALHGHLSRLDLPCDAGLLDEVDAWLTRLLRNVPAPDVSHGEWAAVLGDAWFEVCTAASMIGPAAWGRYRGSVLARYASPPPSRLLKFAIKSALRLDRSRWNGERGRARSTTSP